jgi:hypothetical protein
MSQSAEKMLSATDPLVARVKGEYREMPGLSVTIPQASRLWQMSPDMCKATLESLVSAKFLARTRTGLYVMHGRSSAT